MFKKEVDVAIAAGMHAVEAVCAIYRTDFSVDWKAADDPVTRADREANELITQALRQAFPDDAICAEEDDSTIAIHAAQRGGRTWFVDPLDGTREFVKKNGEFCIMIGLAIDGTAVLGLIAEPEPFRLTIGVVGQGVHAIRRDHSRVGTSPSGQTDPANTRLILSRSRRDPSVDALIKQLSIPTVIGCGSSGVKAARVIHGDADAYLHNAGGLKLWDVCAADAIARAAGLEATNIHGRPFYYQTAELELRDGLVIAHPELAAKLRADLLP